MRWMLLLLPLLLMACSTAPTRPTPAGSSPPDAQLERDPVAARQRLTELERTRALADQLTPYLRHPDGRIRARAALALARVADPAGAAALIDALADREPQVRALAAFALGALDSELPLLADQIAAGHKGSESWVRTTAHTRANTERALDARLHVEGNPMVRRAVYAALGRVVIGPGLHHIYAGLGEQGAEAAQAALAYGVHGIRRGDKAHRNAQLSARLKTLAASPDAEVRFAAAFALARHELCDAAAELRAAVASDGDARVRTWTVRSLGACPGDGTTLLAALDDQDWRVRVEALRALARRAKDGQGFDRAPVQALARSLAVALRSGEAAPGTSQVLLGCLPLLEEVSSLKALQKQLRPGSARVETGVDSALDRLRCELRIEIAARDLELAPLASCAGLPVEPYRIKLRELRALGRALQTQPPLISRLHPYAQDPDPRVRVQALRALVGADDAATRSLLRSRLGVDTDAGVIESIADMVAGWPADPALVDELRSALVRTQQSSDANVVSARAALARALVVHGKDSAATDLTRLSRTGSLQVRNAVRRSLGEQPYYGEAPEFGPVPGLDVTALQARVHTLRGTLELDLFGAEAPETVGNFVRLARNGFYDGLTFHRVVPGFVVQAGDPRGDGYGGPGYVVPCEVTPRPYERGTVGMALAGRDTGGSQFFIAQSRQPHLDGGYTAFAQVISGWAVLDELLQGDAILGIDIVAKPAVAPVAGAQR